MATKSAKTTAKKATAKKATKSKKASAKKAPASSSALINFSRAEVRPGIVPKTYFLIVYGTKPCLNLTVELVPLIYIRQPEFWGIEVRGTLSGPCLTSTAPYHVFISLEGILGTKGIEVIGKSTKKKIKVP
jgi:hypothetical protein